MFISPQKDMEIDPPTSREVKGDIVPDPRSNLSPRKTPPPPNAASF